MSGLRRRAADEWGRAARAAAIAVSYEARQAAGPEYLRLIRRRMAVLYRQMEERHQASAALHEMHAARLENWLDVTRDEAFRPLFMSSVAAAIGVGSAMAVLRGERQVTMVAASSDATARAAHGLEAALGEGPGMAAIAGRGQIRVGGQELLDRWPLYGPAVAEIGVRSVVAVPLELSGCCLGALCGYRGEPFIEDHVAAAARRVADAFTHTVLLEGEAQQTGGQGSADGAWDVLDLSPLFGEVDYQPVVHQAAGMVSVKYDCSVDDAEDLIRARSFADGLPIEVIAEGVLSGELRLY